VDNLTHALCGAALAKTRLRELSPFAAPALVVAANLPDVDIAARVFGGYDAYLVEHRGITHSILGVVALSLAMGAALFALERRLAPRASPKFARAALLCFAGLATHPLLDFATSYGWRPFLPFDRTWYYGDLVFIVDPWLWLAFGAVAALAGERTRVGSRWLALTAVFAVVLVVAIGTRRAIDGLGIATLAWALAALAIAWMRERGVGREHPGRVVAAVAVLIAAYFGVLFASNRAATARARELAAGETIEAAAANPRPANPLAWRSFVQTPKRILVRDFDASREPGPLLALDRGAGDPFVERALSSDCSAAWRSFARFGYASVIEHGGGRDVHLIDARYQLAPGELEYLRTGDPRDLPRRTWCSAVVRFDREGRSIGCER
jgi:inner membrane protein